MSYAVMVAQYADLRVRETERRGIQDVGPDSASDDS